MPHGKYSGKHNYWEGYMQVYKCKTGVGFMVSALVPRSSSLGSSPGQGHCVVFLGKTLNSYSASLHPGVYIGTGELLSKYKKLLGSDLRSCAGGVEIFLAASCYRNRNKLQ